MAGTPLTPFLYSVPSSTHINASNGSHCFPALASLTRVTEQGHQVNELQWRVISRESLSNAFNALVHLLTRNDHTSSHSLLQACQRYSSRSADATSSSQMLDSEQQIIGVLLGTVAILLEHGHVYTSPYIGRNDQSSSPQPVADYLSSSDHVQGTAMPFNLQSGGLYAREALQTFLPGAYISLAPRLGCPLYQLGKCDICRSNMSLSNAIANVIEHIFNCGIYSDPNDRNTKVKNPTRFLELLPRYSFEDAPLGADNKWPGGRYPGRAVLESIAKKEEYYAAREFIPGFDALKREHQEYIYVYCHLAEFLYPDDDWQSYGIPYPYYYQIATPAGQRHYFLQGATPQMSYMDMDLAFTQPQAARPSAVSTHVSSSISNLDYPIFQPSDLGIGMGSSTNPTSQYPEMRMYDQYDDNLPDVAHLYGRPTSALAHVGDLVQDDMQVDWAQTDHDKLLNGPGASR